MNKYMEEIKDVLETVVEKVVEIVKAPDVIEVEEGTWNIVVSDNEGKTIKKFKDLALALDFARENGYKVHAN